MIGTIHKYYDRLEYFVVIGYSQKYNLALCWHMSTTTSQQKPGFPIPTFIQDDSGKMWELLTACSVENAHAIKSTPVSSISEEDRASLFRIPEVLSVAQNLAAQIAAKP